MGCSTLLSLDASVSFLSQVQSIAEDVASKALQAQPGRRGRAGLLALLERQYGAVVTWDGWGKIDKEERRRGRAKGKPREKITQVQDMLLSAQLGVTE